MRGGGLLGLIYFSVSPEESSSVPPLVKKESTDNDETILPSPTSGPPNIPSLLKNLLNTPLKKSQLSLKSKSDNLMLPYDPENLENNTNNNTDNEDSFNFLKPERITKHQKHSPKKDLSMDYDETHCDITASLSILQHVDMMSPSKRPLAENKNIVNVSSHNVDAAGDSSMSLLHPENLHNPSEDNMKRKILEPVEPVYKEPVLRKKAEKRALPGWSCDQCRLLTKRRQFYDELYKDNPEMLAKKMDECSKHRGRNNPARPNTPEGFWNPRWDVPDNTEEFNRRNNAI
ncbi:unnamed protein product [Diatraea saccharalis]|uniref:DNA endonuclease RBBP8 n=1 Tax=Diatraea saccharalis TaxID=40085 RepID=A0A9N9WBM7_9NEOP|nr:unnamed protein product [Diatraea saccharalis]